MMDVSNLSEKQLDVVYKKYANTVYRLAFSRMKSIQDAEDILQDVFIKYMKSDVVFENEEHEKAWFFRVTLNLSKNLLASAWFRKTTQLEDDYAKTFESNTDYQLMPYVLALPKKYRTVIHLYYYEDYSTKEIADLLQVADATVRSWLYRARGELKERMKGEDEFEF